MPNSEGEQEAHTDAVSRFGIDHFCHLAFVVIEKGPLAITTVASGIVLIFGMFPFRISE